MSSFDDVLIQIGNYLHLPAADAYDLKAFADEDTLGGRGDGNFDAWSIDADEGKVLYALTRALRPANVIEIGVREGASTAHLLAGINANGSGHLDSYDLEANGAHQRDNWTFHQADALTVEFPPAELVFEDGGHGLDFSLKIFERLKAFAHIVITHDTNMTTAHGDFHVREAFETVFPDGILLTIDGCERGIGVWCNPSWTQVYDIPVTEAQSEAIVNPPKPVRKPRTPAAKKPATKAKAKR